MVEVGFIVFLFYSNLLMGEFTHSNDQGKKEPGFRYSRYFHNYEFRDCHHLWTDWLRGR
jgi:hypothetical protein